MIARLAFLFVLALGLSSPVLALDPDLRLQQLRHTRWTAKDGAPTVTRIVQDSTGFLWFSGPMGLIRFDGTVFETIHADLGPDASQSTTSVMVSSDGRVWTWYQDANAYAYYEGGKLHFIRGAPRLGTVVCQAVTTDGALWSAVGEGRQNLLRYSQGKWEQISVDPGHPQHGGCMAMVTTADGALWVSFSTGVYRLPKNGKRFEHIVDAPDRGSGRFTLDHAGALWVVVPGGVRRLSGPLGHDPIKFARFPGTGTLQRQNIVIDKDGILWTAINGEGVSRQRDWVGPKPPPVERMTENSGLASNSAGSVFEDRDGNIWLGVSDGVDQLSYSAVVREPDLTRPGSFLDVPFAAPDGTVYIGESDTIYRIPPHGKPEPIIRQFPETETFCSDGDGGIWAVNSSKAVRWHEGVKEATTLPPVGDDYVNQCLVDDGGTLLVTVGHHGLFRYSGGKWSVDSRAGFAPDFIVRVGQKIYINWDEKSIAEINGPVRSRERFDLEKIGILKGLHAVDGRLIVRGTKSIGVWDGHRFRYTSVMQFPGIQRIRGIAESRSGDVWISGFSSVMSLQKEDFFRAAADPAFVPKAVIFGPSDGLPGIISGERPSSIEVGGDGRVWIATTVGSVWLDPQREASHRTATPVAIRALTVDGNIVRNPGALDLPAGTKAISIAFSLLDHTTPWRTQLRYRLEGFDKEWIDPGQRREAFYTNLPPGDYTFVVRAVGEKGETPAGTALVRLHLPPTFLQSQWFVALCAAVIGILALLAFRWRLRSVTTVLHRQNQIRLAERERIARDLHDTLLQSVQSLNLMVSTAAQRLSREEPVRALLERVVDRGEQAVIEGRNKVHDLRTSEASIGLTTLMREGAALLPFPATSRLRISVEGDEQAVEPVVATELIEIAREALFNAARHAHASAVDLVISFGRHELKISVRDDGCGLSTDVLTLGSPDRHYGFAGMRERASKIGAVLRIESEPGKGVLVVVSIPSGRCYSHRLPSRRMWLRSWWHRLSTRRHRATGSA